MGLRTIIRDRCIATKPTDTVNLETDAVYRLLGNRRRRVLLVTLNDLDGAVTVSELTRIVAAVETDTEALDVDTEVYERHYVSVYQSHLPTLAEHDVVEWNRERGIVDGTDLVGPLAEIVRDIDGRVVSSEQP